MPSRKSHLQFYADECFPLTTVTYLKSLGYSIIHAFDHHYIKKSDRFHLAESKKMKRVLITLDRDFSQYESMSLKNHPGVITISVGTSTSPQITKVSEKVLKVISEDYMKESLIIVTIEKIIKQKNGVKTERSY